MVHSRLLTGGVCLATAEIEYYLLEITLHRKEKIHREGRLFARSCDVRNLRSPDNLSTLLNFLGPRRNEVSLRGCASYFPQLAPTTPDCGEVVVYVAYDRHDTVV